jgi:hypothetical protein
VFIDRPVAQGGFWIPATAIAGDHRGLWRCFVFEPHDRRVNEIDGARGAVGAHSVEVLHAETDRVFVRGTLVDSAWLVADGLQRLTPGQEVRARRWEGTLTDAAAGPARLPAPSAAQGASPGEHGP